MLKKITTIMLAVILIISLVGCQGKEETNSSDKANSTSSSASQSNKELTSIEKIKQAGKIVVGTESTFPPFESVDPADGKTIVGFDMDIAAKVAEKLGVKLEIKDMQFASLVTAVNTGMIDFVAAGMNPTPDREEEVDFSKIYYKTKQVLVVKNDSNIKTIDDLKGKKIGAQLGSTSEEVANTIEGATVTTMDKVNNLVLEVQSGRLDGLVLENVTAGNQSKVGGVKIVEIPELNKDGEAGIAIAVKEGDKELLEVINNVLDELQSSGEYNSLLEKWGMMK